MNIIKSLYNRLCKVETSIPPKRKTRNFCYDLLTEQEQGQARAFMDSLPINIHMGMDLSKLSSEQIETLGNWLRLEDALQRQDVAKAEEMRKRLEPIDPALVSRIRNFGMD